MIEKSVARPARNVPASDGDLEHVSSIVRRSTRHLIVDARFVEILAEDFPQLGAAAIGGALYEHPCRAAIALCEWAIRREDPRRALRNWAKKNRPRRPRLQACDGCGSLFEGCDLVELHEDNHDNLTHFHGDMLCKECCDGAGVTY